MFNYVVPWVSPCLYSLHVACRQNQFILNDSRGRIELSHMDRFTDRVDKRRRQGNRSLRIFDIAYDIRKEIMERLPEIYHVVARVVLRSSKGTLARATGAEFVWIVELVECARNNYVTAMDVRERQSFLSQWNAGTVWIQRDCSCEPSVLDGKLDVLRRMDRVWEHELGWTKSNDSDKVHRAAELMLRLPLGLVRSKNNYHMDYLVQFILGDYPEIVGLLLTTESDRDLMVGMLPKEFVMKWVLPYSLERALNHLPYDAKFDPDLIEASKYTDEPSMANREVHEVARRIDFTSMPAWEHLRVIHHAVKLALVDNAVLIAYSRWLRLYGKDTNILLGVLATWMPMLYMGDERTMMYALARRFMWAMTASEYKLPNIQEYKHITRWWSEWNKHGISCRHPDITASILTPPGTEVRGLPQELRKMFG